MDINRLFEDKNYLENEIEFYFKKTAQKTTQKELNKIQTKILSELKKNPSLTRAELALIIQNITEDGIKYNLKVLSKIGYIKRVGGRKEGHWEVKDE